MFICVFPTRLELFHESVIMVRIVLDKGCSSVGRATVSKTVGRGFEPCRPCHYSERIS